MCQHVGRAASRNRLIHGLKYVRLHTSNRYQSFERQITDVIWMLGVTLRYFILRIKYGPLTTSARKIIALPEVRRNDFDEGSPTFISHGAYCVLIGGKLRGKSITARDDFRIWSIRSFCADVSLTLSFQLFARIWRTIRTNDNYERKFENISFNHNSSLCRTTFISIYLDIWLLNSFVRLILIVNTKINIYFVIKSSLWLLNGWIFRDCHK